MGRDGAASAAINLPGSKERGAVCFAPEGVQFEFLALFYLCQALPVPHPLPECEEEEGEGIFTAMLSPQGHTHLV